MSKYVIGPMGIARWYVAPWLVPRGRTSWVPLPRTIISRIEFDQASERHFLHEMAHVYQIQRDGYLRRVFRYVCNWIRYGRKNHPAEIEARKLAQEWMNDR
jgi:hypothetical protein